MTQINLTLFTNHSSDVVTGTGAAINTASDGIFGFGILLAAYAVLFFVMIRWGAKQSFIATSFIGAVLAMFLRLINWIQDPVLYGAFILAVIGVLVAIFSKD